MRVQYMFIMCTRVDGIIHTGIGNWPQGMNNIATVPSGCVERSLVVVDN